MQPRALLLLRERDVGLGPQPGRAIFFTIERRGAKPILERELVRILDPAAALLGTVDEEQSSERPERLSAKTALGFLIDDDDAFARARDFGCRDESREPRSDHNDVGDVAHRYAGRRRIIVIPRIVITTSPFWFNASVSPMTIPRSALLADGRTSRTVL